MGLTDARETDHSIATILRERPDFRRRRTQIALSSLAFRRQWFLHNPRRSKNDCEVDTGGQGRRGILRLSWNSWSINIGGAPACFATTDAIAEVFGRYFSLWECLRALRCERVPLCQPGLLWPSLEALREMPKN